MKFNCVVGSEIIGAIVSASFTALASLLKPDHSPLPQPAPAGLSFAQSSSSGVLQAVRAATMDDHKRTEARFADALARLPDSYGRYLLAHASAFAAVGQALSQALDWAPWQERWNDLLDDLAQLGLTPPPALEIAAARGAGESLGMIYVLEGSRMGSAIVLKSIPGELPTAYLRGGLDTAPWHRTKELLNRAPGEMQAHVIAGARAAFRAFEDAARLHFERQTGSAT